MSSNSITWCETVSRAFPPHRRGRADSQLAEALESVTEGVVLFGPDDRLVLSNAKYREIYPLISDILVPGTSFEAILHAALERGHFEDADGRAEEWVAERVQRHRTESEPVERLLGDGRWYRISQRTTGSGDIVQIFTDVTELIGRETALRESQRRFRDFAETSADWLWEIDAERRITYFSGDLAGRDSQSMIGRSWHDLLVESSTDTTITSIIDGFLDRSAGFRDIEFRMAVNGPGGIASWGKISGTPVLDSDGRMVACRGATSDITERRRAEQALRKSEARAARAQTQLIDAIESISEGFVLFDAEDRLILTNNKYRAMFSGAAADIRRGATYEALCRAYAERGEIVIQDVSAETWVNERLERHQKTDGAEEIELRDGRWLRTSEQRTQDGGTVAVATDITELKMREAALRREALILEQMSDAVILTDLAGVIIDWSPGAAKMFGYAKDEMLGRGVESILGVGGADFSQPQIVEHLRREGHWNAELGFARKDGTAAISESALVPFYDERGKMIATVGVHRDITERRKAREAIRRSEEHFRSLIENASDIITVVDPHGVIHYTSPSVERMLGHAANRLDHHNLLDFVHPDDTDGLADALADSADAGHAPAAVEFRFRHGDGAWRILEGIAEGLREDTDGRRIVVNSRDITERREFEERLAQTQKMNALGQLTGGVAHDFNNLLTVILGFASMAQRDPSDPERIETCLSEVVKAAEKATQLTSQLLAFSRKQVLEPRLIHLGEMMLDLKMLLEPLLGENVELRIEPADAEANVEADPVQLSQAIVNLAINGRDAMSEGGLLSIAATTAEVDAETAAHHEVAPGTYVAVAVQDAGSGIDAELMDHIFEPFFTTKEPGQGTGLGLSMVYGMVRQSKGFLAVDSTPGTGTTFTISLPRAAGSPQTPAEPAVEARVPALPGTHNETIVLVEDEDGVRDLAEMTLAELGYDVLTARDGGDAARVLEDLDGPIHLLLTDVVMPGWPGPEIARAVRATRPQTKVIYMSGYPSRGNSTTADIKLDDPFLQKPFKPTDLVALVRKVLDG